LFTALIIFLSLIGLQALSIGVTLYFNRFGIYGSGTWFGSVKYLTNKKM